MLKKIAKKWVIYFILGLALLQVMVFTLWGDHSFIAIHDNLDLFVAHNKIMKNIDKERKDILSKLINAEPDEVGVILKQYFNAKKSKNKK